MLAELIRANAVDTQWAESMSAGDWHGCRALVDESQRMAAI